LGQSSRITFVGLVGSFNTAIKLASPLEAVVGVGVALNINTRKEVGRLVACPEVAHLVASLLVDHILVVQVLGRMA